MLQSFTREIVELRRESGQRGRLEKGDYFYSVGREWVVMFLLLQLKDLHNSGYSLLSIDPQGQTALHWAARHGHRDIIKYLLAASPPALLDMVDNEK